MARRYRMPFVFDGRAEAQTGAGSNANDLYTIWDTSEERNYPIRLDELTSGLQLAGGLTAGWLPAWEYQTELTGGTPAPITISSAEAGAHHLYSVDTNAALIGIDATWATGDLADGLAVGDWFHLSLVNGIEEEMTGGPAIATIAFISSEFGAWGGSGAPQQTFDVAWAGAGLMTFSFYCAAVNELDPGPPAIYGTTLNMISHHSNIVSGPTAAGP